MAFMGATLGGLVTLRCPHCGELQVRGRKPVGERWRCRRCHRLFGRDEGSPPELAGVVAAEPPKRAR